MSVLLVLDGFVLVSVLLSPHWLCAPTSVLREESDDIDNWKEVGEGSHMPKAWDSLHWIQQIMKRLGEYIN